MPLAINFELWSKIFNCA